MAGKLVQVATSTVTSGVLSVSLTGIDSDDVYLVTVTDLVSFNDAQDLFYRVTASGVADTTANYDKASKILRTDTTFTNTSFTNGTSVSDIRGGTGTGEKTQLLYHLYNFNNASEYSFIIQESVAFDSGGKLAGFSGGAVHTVAQANDGINFFYNAGNITGGTFTLYRIV